MHVLSGDLVVVSPHLDDAVLSLGASMTRATRLGRRIQVLTVFAGDPDSRKPAGGWDRRGGFQTEGEAATTRRLEDQEACGLVGAEPTWLAFSEADYRGAMDEDAVWSAVTDALGGALAVLVPGFPLTNPDHAWLSELLIERGLPCRRVGLYAEQPYRFMVRKERRRLEIPVSLRRGHVEVSGWTHPAGPIPDLRTKRMAILAYRSQMRLLSPTERRSRKLDSMLLHETLRRGEAIAWLHDR